jgi:hypothetical protein
MTIRTSARRNGKFARLRGGLPTPVWVGLVTVYAADGKQLYSMFTKIERLSQVDAVWDAEEKARELRRQDV